MASSITSPNGWVEEEVKTIVKGVIEHVIGEQVYDTDKANYWCEAIAEQSLVGLANLRKPFKYILNCYIMRKSDSRLELSSVAFWDSARDGCCQVRYENASLRCVVAVFGARIMKGGISWE